MFSAIQGNLEQRACSRQTIKAYLGQLGNFVSNKNLTNPRDVTDVEIRQYLADLITQGKSRSTADQAYNELSYFHKAVQSGSGFGRIQKTR